MKNSAILTFSLLIISVNLFASYSTDWIKPADNYLKSGTMIARDKSDNVIVTGYIQNENIYTRKYDKFGNFKWEQVSSSTVDNNYEKPGWVNCTKNKNIYVVGYRYTIGSGWEYPNAVVVLKYNSSGSLLWKQNIDLSYIVGSSTGLKFNLRSDVDNKENLYIATAGTSPSGFILIKLNSNGTVLINTTVNLGSVHGFSSMRLKGNKVVATGTASYNQNLVTVAWDTAGALLWTKTIEDGFPGNDVEVDGNGNSYILTSYPDQVSGTSGNDILIYKFNSIGDEKWKKAFDFGGEDFATRFTLVSGKLSVIGYGNIGGGYLDHITFQINSSGTLLWDARYNEAPSLDERPYFVAAKASGEVFVTGSGGPPYVQNGSSYLRMVTLKYGSNGDLQWADTVNVYSGWGIACTLASDSSLFVLTNTKMTVFHFLDHPGTGTCNVPANLKVTNITDTTAKFSWSAVAGAYLYHLRYKTTSATEWTTISTDETSIKIKTFTAGTSYYYAVEAICNNGPSGYSDSLSFTTTGVGYCTTGGLSTAQEYLTLVWIGSIQNSTVNNNGYADFTNLSTDLTQGEQVYGYLQGNHPFPESEYYSIWIDYNGDNDFTDANELAASTLSSNFGYISVNFLVPLTASPGVTRMRVTQSHDGPPSPCGSYSRGETEDYSITIMSQRNSPDESDAVKIFPNLFTDRLFIESASNEEPFTLYVYDMMGKLQHAAQLSGSVNEMSLSFLESGVYFIRIVQDGRITETVKVIKQ